MYTTIEIAGFRGIERLKLDGLARVNLLVGKNNSGKTSVLEAIELLTSGGSLSILAGLQMRRGERHADRDPRRPTPMVDITQLFYGRDLNAGAEFQIASRGDRSSDTTAVHYELDSLNIDPLFEDPFGDDDAESVETHCMLVVSDGSSRRPLRVPVARSGALSLRYARNASGEGPLLNRPVNFLSTDGAANQSLLSEWSRVVLTDEEEHVYTALRLLEPRLERLAVVVDGRVSRPTVMAKLADFKQPVPLGSMGDGMWRMLLLALAVIRSAGGVLLVDEVETGLHHSVLKDMWTLISHTAARLDVQVFATTHSNDCVEALAAAIDDGNLADHAALHRIEKGRTTSVRYSEVQIVAAARHRTEVR